MAAFYWLIEVRQWRRWCQPFVWIGANPSPSIWPFSLWIFDRLPLGLSVVMSAAVESAFCSRRSDCRGAPGLRIRFHFCPLPLPAENFPAVVTLPTID